MTSASSSGRARPAAAPGVQLDASDPTDKRIIARQVTVARKAGRDGLDRAASTRGRSDLESAYDEGAAKASAPAADEEDEPGAGPSPPPSASTGPGWKAFRPTSPARPPTRAADAGGFLSGLALYTVVVIYVRYGAAGWKGWLKAKFLNQPMSSKTSSGSTGKPTTKSGGTAAV